MLKGFDMLNGYDSRSRVVTPPISCTCYPVPTAIHSSTVRRHTTTKQHVTKTMHMPHHYGHSVHQRMAHVAHGDMVHWVWYHRARGLRQPLESPGSSTTKSLKRDVLCGHMVIWHTTDHQLYRLGVPVARVAVLLHAAQRIRIPYQCITFSVSGRVTR